MHPEFIRKISHPIWEIKNRCFVNKALHELEKSQWYSDEHLRDLQWTKVKKLLRHCFENIPYYFHLFNERGLRPDDFTSPEDLKKIPILTKSDLQNNFGQLIAHDKRRPYIVRRTSGTCGTPSTIYIEKHAMSHQMATQLRGRRWWGWEMGDSYVSLRGRAVQQKNHIRIIRDRIIENRKVLSVFNITKDSVRRHFSVIEKFRPKFLYAWSNGIYTLTKLFKENDMDASRLNLQGICTTAEILYAHQRSLIESVFRCPVINEYGCAEVGVISFQCPERGMHISCENVFVEFIQNKDKDYPQHLHEIIVTDLNNYVMPLLRYRTGDLGNVHSKPCSCGRMLPKMDIEIGRELDMILLKEGKLVHPAIIPFMVSGAIEKYGERIKQFKVIQKSVDHFLMIVAAESGFIATLSDYFREAFRSQLGDDVKVDFNFVDHILREKSGKYREFVSEIGIS